MRPRLVWAGIGVTDFVYPGDKPGFYLAWQAVFVAFCENGYDISQKKEKTWKLNKNIGIFKFIESVIILSL